MIRPDIHTRVIKRDVFFGNGIGCGDSDVFVAVASLAGKRQIRLAIRTAAGLGNDVLDAKRVRTVFPLRETVFAAKGSSFPNRPANGAAN